MISASVNIIQGISMKKLSAVIFTVLLLFSYAMAENGSEIIFQGIPWLSDNATVVQKLIDDGFLRNGTNQELSCKYVTYLVEDDVGSVSPNRLPGVDEVTFTTEFNGTVRGKIAGYPIKDLVLTYAFDGDYKLIAVNVELINGNYDDLKNKLITVYGDAEFTETEEGIWSSVWKGDNDSAVVLYTQSEGLDYTLMYGRLDAAEILSNCLAPADPDDVSGL